MGTTGLIFGVLVAAWLAYLVPWFVNHRGQQPEDGPTIDLTEAGRLLQSGEEETVEPDISTPLTRRAAKHEIASLAWLAARRRRRVLAVLLLLATTLAVTTIVHLTPWWLMVWAGALVPGWLIVARVSVARMHHQLDEQVASLDLGDDEATISVRVENLSGLRELDDAHEHSVEISAPVPKMNLFDPIPVSANTYLSRPLAQRTVRTIDLSAPAALPAPTPVTADAGLSVYPVERRMASGE